MWNLLLNVKGLWKYPSVKPAACQLPFQGSLNKKASLEKGGEPPLGGGGIFMWNLLLNVKGLRYNPSVTCGASSPFRGAKINLP